MRHSIAVFIFLFSLLAISEAAAPESIMLVQNGKEIKEKISLKSSGKIEITLPVGWRYISGKVKILQGDEVKKSQQIVGETNLQAFDLLQFLKLNAVPGNYVSFELSVRTKESGTLATMKFPIE
jgi:hypothetical protein